MKHRTGCTLWLWLALTACSRHSSIATQTRAATNDAPPAHLDSEIVSFQSVGHTLKGQLYRPQGEGPYPAVIFNHGSERSPGERIGLARFYTSHGYAFFTPHRRGHGMSQGEYYDDVASRAPLWNKPAEVTRLLVEQVQDVLAAINTLRARTFIDRDHLAVVGCSFGGIETLLAAEQGGFRAAIDFAGGAMSWNYNASLRERLASAARNAKVPVYFIQAENDFSIEPSKVLSQEMQAAHKPHAMKIFPPFGTTPQQGRPGTAALSMEQGYVRP